MKEIKLYSEFLYQYAYKAFLVFGGIVTLIPFMMLTIIGIVFKIEGASEFNISMNFQLNQAMVGFMFVIGIVAIAKAFEIGMRIRADRKHFTIALGLMTIIAAVITGVWQYLVGTVFEIIMRRMVTQQGVSFNTDMIGTMGIIETINLSLFMIMLGVLIGCIYNRLSVRNFILFIIGSIMLMLVSIWGMIYYNEALFIKIIEWVMKTPYILNSMFLVLAGVCYGISAYLLQKASFGNYSVTSGYIRIGKKSVGHIRV